MTYEEVIKILETSGAECPTCGVPRDVCAKETICLYDKAKSIAIKAMKKQIAIKNDSHYGECDGCKYTGSCDDCCRWDKHADCYEA